jgi:chromosome partitioning protein
MSSGADATGLGWPAPSADEPGSLGWPSTGSTQPVSRETEPPLPTPDVSRETDELPPLADVPTGPVEEPSQPATPTRRTFEPWPRPARRRVLGVANQKGGVGKTTSTVNLAVALAQHGARVLVIDLDPQGNASTAFGVDHRGGTPSVYDVLVDGRPLDEVAAAVEDVPGLFCAPATIDVAGAEIELVSVVARESRLAKAIAAMERDYDYVFIDCPPSLGLLTVNALVAAEEVLIPIQCEFYALEGLSQLLKNIEMVRSHLNRDLHVSTILLTMYDGRTRLAEQVAQEVRTHFGELVIGATIPRSVRISEAPGYGQTVMTYDPSSRGALAYADAAREIAMRSAEPPAGALPGSPVNEWRAE